MIHSHTANELQARSFDHNNDNNYTIPINEETNTMISCNCPDAIRSGALCKHMFLVNRMERIGFPETANHQEETLHQQQQQDTQPQPQPQPLLSDAMTK
jgi:hypothetical protein